MSAPAHAPGTPSAPGGAVAIRVRGLVTRFGAQVVHDGLDLDVRRGEIIGIVGGSGTGKSVLLREVIGLMRPSAGAIEVFGQDTARLGAAGLRRMQRNWGVLFQDGALFSGMTVAQNIQVPLRRHLKLSRALMDDIARIKIGMVGLPADAATKLPSQLSGGMRKRAGLARALALDPPLILLDEPTAGLDPIGAAAFDDLIGDLSRSLNLTVFMVTHDLDSLHAICDRIAVLIDRKIVVDTMETLLEHPHPWIRSYFHGPRGRAALDGPTPAGAASADPTTIG